jgi:F0F1-type ATP synthase assembly protein I
VADLSTKRELNRGAGDALATAFELAVTPAVLALVGWRLDIWLGTTPALLLALFLFTMGYEVWKHLTRYDAQMREQEAQVPGLTARAVQPDGRPPGEPGS